MSGLCCSRHADGLLTHAGVHAHYSQPASTFDDQQGHAAARVQHHAGQRSANFQRLAGPVQGNTSASWDWAAGFDTAAPAQPSNQWWPDSASQPATQPDNQWLNPGAQTDSHHPPSAFSDWTTSHAQQSNTWATPAERAAVSSQPQVTNKWFDSQAHGQVSADEAFARQLQTQFDAEQAAATAAQARVTTSRAPTTRGAVQSRVAASAMPSQPARASSVAATESQWQLHQSRFAASAAPAAVYVPGVARSDMDTHRLNASGVLHAAGGTAMASPAAVLATDQHSRSAGVGQPAEVQDGEEKEEEEEEFDELLSMLMT